MRANNNSLTVIDARDDPQPEYCKGYSYQAQL